MKTYRPLPNGLPGIPMRPESQGTWMLPLIEEEHTDRLHGAFWPDG